MVIVKDWKKYYTMEESSKILDERFKKSAKKFAQEVIVKSKKNKRDESQVNEPSYV